MSRCVIQCFPWDQAPEPLKALDATADPDGWVVVMPVSLLTTYRDHPLVSFSADGNRVKQYDHPSDPHYRVFIGSPDPD